MKTKQALEMAVRELERLGSSEFGPLSDRASFLECVKTLRELGEAKTPLASKADNAQGQTDSTPRPLSEARYVVGFLFDASFQAVALIRKNKPEWQAGLLNGIGGKIEVGEMPMEAMHREFKEEAGLDGLIWCHFASLSGTNNDGGAFELECFWTTSERLNRIRSQEAEQIEVITVRDISGQKDTIGNLPWLIMLARDFGRGVFPPRFVKAEYGPSVVDGTAANPAPGIPKSASGLTGTEGTK